MNSTNNNYNCGVANDAGTYKTVGLSFEMGGLVDAGAGNTRQDLLDSIMNFFDITTEVEELTEIDVKTPFLQLSPNPFTNFTDIRLQITDDGNNSNANAELRIFDATGRMVRNLDLSSVVSEQSSISWYGDDNAGRKLPAGVYFIQFDTGSHTEAQKVILIE